LAGFDAGIGARVSGSARRRRPEEGDEPDMWAPHVSVRERGGARARAAAWADLGRAREERERERSWAEIGPTA
jgi:hypothetical protein